MSLPDKLLEIHAALEQHGIPHAFGGAIALAYWTTDPRGTSDIDLNVFAPPEEADQVLAALPEGIVITARARALIARDGQARLFWDQTPVDLFFDNHPIHARAAGHHVIVEFSGTRIPILGPIELALFKALFDRTQDWADIEAMIASLRLDPDAVRDLLLELIGAEDERFARLDEAQVRAERSRQR
ncbi:MAG: hypothetical protein H0U42_04460 [Thermoleophilaceae bacterium]|nr:hypothetical protein [Thermoleophilaceae bacterium]